MGGLHRLPSSFRDPCGYIFVDNGAIKRAVTDFGRENYDLFLSTGLYDQLLQRKYLVPHHEEEPSERGIHKILLPNRIPVITYPYEWSFSALKDAALLTLDIQKTALEHGMSLKDATPYNIQFLDGKPLMIDTLSFEKFQNKPWVAYKQFCEIFLAPLVLMAYVKADYNKYLSNDINGFDLQFCSKVLPRATWFNPNLLAHIHLHALSQTKYGSPSAKAPTHTSLNFSLNQMNALIDSLKSAVAQLKIKKSKTSFGDYYAECQHYTEKAEHFKTQLIEEWLNILNPKRVTDLGANNGRYSRLVTKRGAFCAAVDNDPLCVNDNYVFSRKENDMNILPLYLDLSNPFPAVGWASKERDSFFMRVQSDLVMALALIHHLRISVNIPLFMLSRFFADIAPVLWIEFVPKNDVMVQKLLANREDTFHDYDQAGFEENFKAYFDIFKKADIPDTPRTLYYLIRKKSAI